jgi:hypothetical protein
MFSTGLSPHFGDSPELHVVCIPLEVNAWEVKYWSTTILKASKCKSKVEREVTQELSLGLPTVVKDFTQCHFRKRAWQPTAY